MISETQSVGLPESAGELLELRPVLKMTVRFLAAGQPHWRRHSLVSYCPNSLLTLSLPLKPSRSPVISDIHFEKRSMPRAPPFVKCFEVSRNVRKGAKSRKPLGTFAALRTLREIISDLCFSQNLMTRSISRMGHGGRDRRQSLRPLPLCLSAANASSRNAG